MTETTTIEAFDEEQLVDAVMSLAMSAAAFGNGQSYIHMAGELQGVYALPTRVLVSFGLVDGEVRFAFGQACGPLSYLNSRFDISEALELLERLARYPFLAGQVTLADDAIVV